MSQILSLKKDIGLWPAARFGDDMIIDILDTGIWPESESFKDHGMPPVPKRWRGACEIGMMFNTSNCNRKLIGARLFNKALKHAGRTLANYDYVSPRDFYGHGTHTSSTAAGSHVIAATSDTLAGIDQAIEDGVDLMSLSLGFGFDPLFQSPISLGTFGAVEKGIFVACSAANSGPDAYTIMNGAPWITTSGAGTLDRDYLAIVTLGKGNSTIKGKSVYPENLYISEKIVFCEFTKDSRIDDQRTELYRTDAAGAIIVTNSTQSLESCQFSFPFVAITPSDGDKVKEYFASTTLPTFTEIGAQQLFDQQDVTDNTNGVILDIATGKPGTPLNYGAGHVNPNKALDPGLIYDIVVKDYINYLCAINYTRQEIAAITRRINYTCENANFDLSHPSFIVILNNTNTTSYTFKRVLTSVVDYKTFYTATIRAPAGMKIYFNPSSLSFEGKNSKAEFSVHVDVDLRGHGMQKSYIGNYGYLSWHEVKGKHIVRSPIVSAYALGKSML
ncbi:hypothetical protein Syun_015296 [Stephania yunnanensis]|uniref:Subtilisin-like protease fibronectin type-III domain-containing protein n=1 Tax=Stephania yunnanensis TaxID=152371 RepID=A0AAP0JKW0_9MAGN